MTQDYIDIVSTVYKYAYGIDTRDWALYRSIFTDRITTDFSSYNGNPAGEMAADDWVKGLTILFTGLDASQHQMSNPLVDIDGDNARCRMYVQAEHFFQNSLGNPDFALGGYYDDQLERTADGWKINSVTLNVLWNRGNRDIMRLAAEKGAEILAAR